MEPSGCLAPTYSREVVHAERRCQVEERILTARLGRGLGSRTRFPESSPAAKTCDARLGERVRQAQDGSGVAFEALVGEVAPSVYRFLLVRLGQEDDARDALQETLVAAWRGLGGLKRPESFRSWLLSIAVRKASEIAKARPLPLGEKPLAEPSLPDSAQLWEVQSALDSLPPKMRDVVLLRYLMGLSERETAQILRTRVGTVKSRAARARGQLAAYLDHQAYPQED